MNSIIDFISENDSIIMTGLFILIIILTAVVTIMDFVNKKNGKTTIEEDENFDVKTSEEIIQDNVVLNINEVISNNTELNVVSEEKPELPNDVTEIRYVEDDEELEKTKAKLELQNLKDELIMAEANNIKEENKENLPVYIGDNEESMETVQSKLDEFEKAQEENAIISLEQFNKISDKVYDENETTQFQYKDEGNEPISIQELEKLYNTREMKVVSEDIIPSIETKSTDATDIIETQEEKVIIPDKQFIFESGNKFKTSPIISPVFGIDVQEKINSIELENTANLGKLDEEIRKTNEFLNTLRELRKNLEP